MIHATSNIGCKHGRKNIKLWNNGRTTSHGAATLKITILKTLKMTTKMTIETIKPWNWEHWKRDIQKCLQYHARIVKVQTTATKITIKTIVSTQAVSIANNVDGDDSRNSNTRQYYLYCKYVVNYCKCMRHERHFLQQMHIASHCTFFKTKLNKDVFQNTWTNTKILFNA